MSVGVYNKNKTLLVKYTLKGTRVTRVALCTCYTRFFDVCYCCSNTFVRGTGKVLP